MSLSLMAALPRPTTAYIACMGRLSERAQTEFKGLVSFLDLKLLDDFRDGPEVVIYATGLNINPRLFGERAVYQSNQFDLVRDGVEVGYYHVCQSAYNANFNAKPLSIGIGRGAHLLNA